MDHVQTLALVAQIACTALAYMLDISDAAKGALLLASFWCLGVNIGAGFAKRCIGGDC